MAFLSSMNIVGSGLTAQQLRLDVISENITNSNTTRTEAGGPYRRKVVVFEAMSGRDDFRTVMARAAAAGRRQRSGRYHRKHAGAVGGAAGVYYL